MFDRFSTDAKRAVAAAAQAAHRFGDALIGPEHLLLGALNAGGEGVDAGVSASAVERRILELRPGTVPRTGAAPEPMSPGEAVELRRQLRHRGVARAKALEIVERIQRERAVGPTELTDPARKVIELALEGTEEDVTVVDLLLALVSPASEEVALVLSGLDLSAAEVRARLS